MKINKDLNLSEIQAKFPAFWEISGEKIKLIEKEFDATQGSPVFTRAGKYTTRGWTEWTQGFQYGSAILQFEATGHETFLKIGRDNTLARMAPHVAHFGVHDHGFNNVSTYGNLLRLMNEGRLEENAWERTFYELALKVSGAVQAKRWTNIPGGGYMYSFNGPHSLFVDTIRTCRALLEAHKLGFFLQDEHDEQFSLLERSIQHSLVTAEYAVFYGENRDTYDIPGRVAHESIFNTNDGMYRCPNSQQGYSGFTTWTRGLAWAMLGFAEQLQAFAPLQDHDFEKFGGKAAVESKYLKAARATCDFYLTHTGTDGIPYWDTGAPNLHNLGDLYTYPADPYNLYEPVDSSASAIAAQALLILGNYLREEGQDYWQAGLTVLNTLLSKPYLSTQPEHHGLLLHSIYHHPNGWDYIPKGSCIPHSESSMWGDYHLREAVMLLQRRIMHKTLSI